MFPYMGGKAKQTWWLDEMFPRFMADDYDTFVDVFGGAGWVSIGSNRVHNVPNHVYNDFNPHLANIYHCFVFKRNDLYNAMLQYPHSDEALWLKFRDELFPLGAAVIMGDVNTAAKYLYLQTQSFIGNTLKATSKPQFINETEGDGGRKSRYEMVRDRLVDDEYIDKLDRITIVENKDCLDVIRDHDSPRTFFYIDPPYFSKEFYYSKDFPRAKHEELANLLATIKGKFALSYYDYEDMHVFYPESSYRWHRQMVDNETARATGNSHQSEEILIMNYSENQLQIPPVKPISPKITRQKFTPIDLESLS